MQFQIIEELNSALKDVTSHTGKAVVAAESWRNKVIMTKVRYMSAGRKMHKHLIKKNMSKTFSRLFC